MAWPECRAISCSRFRGDCQARSPFQGGLVQSFGEADAMVYPERRLWYKWSDPTMLPSSSDPRRCQERHEHYTAKHLDVHFDNASEVSCLPASQGGSCTTRQLEQAELLTPLQRVSKLISTKLIDEPAKSPPLVLFAPVTESVAARIGFERATPEERLEYHGRYQYDYFLRDAYVVYRSFFADTPMR